MNIYERLSMLEDALGKTETEADVLLGFVSETGVVYVCPRWECETSPTDLQKELAHYAVTLADQASEGAWLGLVADKRNTAP